MRPGRLAAVSGYAPGVLVPSARFIHFLPDPFISHSFSINRGERNENVYMQPIMNSVPRGLLAAALVTTLSLCATVTMSPATLSGWASLVLVAMVPTQVVSGLLWKNGYPRTSALLPQPARGLLQLAMTIAIGACVAFTVLHTLGGGAPTPFAIMFLILSVPVTFCLVAVWGAWPLRCFVRNEGLLGLALLAAAYAVTYLLFRTLFSFSFASQAPFYRSALDPHGAFAAWYPLAAALDALVFMLIGVLFDFWPVAALARRFPLMGGQPAAGIAVSIGVATCAALLWHGFVDLLAMDVVMFMTRICVCTIFGIFVVLVMLEGLPALQVPQPLRGVLLTAVAVATGQAAFVLYGLVAERTFHLLPGAPAYALELWLASSMLSVTFPAMVLFAQYFQFWPLASRGNPIAAPHCDTA